MTHRAPVAQRSVKPRKPTDKPVLPIISYTPEVIYVERDDIYHEPSQIQALVRTEPPSLIVASGIAQLLLLLHESFHKDPQWQFGASPIEHQRYHPDRSVTHSATRDTAIAFLGFQGKPLEDGPRGGKRHEANRYHTTLDPITFAKKAIADMGLAGIPTVEALYIWATEVRRYAANERLTLRPTNGGLSSQLLRDKRFYPNPRRKVPTATNSIARDKLPGNHYRLVEKLDTEFDAYYLDQIASHHACASTVTFPHSNQLKAHGWFRNSDTDKWGCPNSVLTGYGLFHVKLSVPHVQTSDFAPPYAQKQGMHTAYVYSNELPWLHELGIGVEHVIAAWASNCRDSGLNKYAKWALGELEREPHAKPWKKPLLLSTYGILAATPRIHRVGYARASGGKPALYPAGAGYIPVIERSTTKPTEPAYANVIHRGMIEAETRMRSLRLARELTKQGQRVIAVYADSVFIHARNEQDQNIAMPFPPEGWQIEAALTRLKFHNPVSFTSDQMTKLPGIPNRDTVLRASRGTQHFPSRQKAAKVVDFVA